MTREEFALIWHDWLRGVSLIGVLLILVAIYFLHLFTPQNYALLVVTIALLGGLFMAGSVCLSGRSPLPVRVLAPLLALTAGLLAYVGVWQAVHLPEPYAEGTLSGTEPKTTLVVPTDGLEESYFLVRGRPGASPSGKDNEVDARLGLSGNGHSSHVKTEFFKNKTAKGQRGSTSLGLRSADAVLLTGLGPGPLEVTLTELKPETALPLQLSLHWPLLPPSAIRFALLAIAVIALVLAVLSARRNQFPFLLPYSIVLVSGYWFVGQGVPPQEPLLPLLGIVIGASIAGSGAGYLIGKGLQLALAPKRP